MKVHLKEPGARIRELLQEGQPLHLALTKANTRRFDSSTGLLPLYAEGFQWVDSYWPCGKAPIPYSEELGDYFASHVQRAIHVGVDGEAIVGDVQPAMFASAPKNLDTASL